MKTSISGLSHSQVIETRPDLVAREIELEDRAINLAKQRITKITERMGYSAVRGSGRDTMRDAVLDVAAAIEAWVTKPRQSKHKAYNAIAAVEPLQLAMLVSRAVLNAAAADQTNRVTLSVKLGKEVKQLIEYALFAEAHTKEAQDLEKKVEGYSEWAAGNVLSKAHTAVSFDELVWSDATIATTGYVLITLFKDATELCHEVDAGTKRNSRIVIRATDKLIDIMAQGGLDDYLLMPYRLPMAIPPKDWSSVYGGGYLDPVKHPLNFVRTGTSNLRRMSSTDLDQVYAAVNAIQSTAWRVNRRVYDVMVALTESDVAVGSLLSSAKPELHAKPWGNLTDAEYATYKDAPENAELVKSTLVELRKSHAARDKWTSQRYIQAQQIEMASLLVDDEAIFFPHNVCFRGRVYPAAGAGSLNPQSDKLGKSLLEFADGKQLGDDGAKWLAIHTANQYGMDKLSMTDRELWALSNSQLMVNVAHAPLENTEWMNAENPFGFLAACFEWAGYVLVGNAYVSHMPIALDGTCNGLQHFSAMLRDEELAEQVNVKQVQDLPADVYSAVRDRAVALLGSDAIGAEWATRIGRDTVKHPTMCTPYGVKQTGIRSQIHKAVAKSIDSGATLPMETPLNDAVQYLTPIVVEALSQVATSATEVLGWLEKVGQLTAKADIPIRWSTPVGFSVEQRVMDVNAERVLVTINGQKTQLKLAVKGSTLNKTKQKSGTAPNFVHSYDAAHACLTVNACKARGVDSFAMIHDSYGTHAADATELSAVLRDEFVGMYQADALIDLYEGLRTQCDEETFALIPTPPIGGDLDLSCVYESEYFFS